MTPKERRKIWVEALRSGKYEQGRATLFADGKFCCLGVACDLFAEEFGLHVSENRGRRSYNGRSAYLPDPLCDALGLADIGGEYIGHSLTDLNDRGATFAEIADIIESEPEGLIVEGM